MRRGYNAALLALSGVLAGGVTACAVHPTAWLFLFAPLLGGAAAALTWCALARFVLCRSPERLMAGSFTRPLKLALSVPLWACFTVLLLSMPGTVAAEEEVLASALGTLLAVVSLTLLPAAAVASETAALVLGVRHMKSASPAESAPYREGPFALAMVLFLGVVTACIAAISCFFG